MKLSKYLKTSRNYVKYSNSFGFLGRLILVHFFSYFEPIFGTKILKINNKLCAKKQYIESSFGNYLVSSLNEYAQMNENYEPEIGELVYKKLSNYDKSEGNYLINIGCNIGRWAIDLSKNYGLNVIAFEPAPETFEKLKINIALSKVEDKFELFNVALGNEEGLLDFEFIPFHSGGSHIVENIG